MYDDHYSDDEEALLAFYLAFQLAEDEDILALFKEGLNGFKGGLSAENYISITKTSRPTATRDLNDLVKKGALIKKGKLKGSRYYMALA